MKPSPTPTFSIGTEQFLLDGKPFVIRCGEMHFARIEPHYWRHRLRMARAMGLNTVCAYLFWNFHEWEEGRFDWTGWRDAAAFCRAAEEEGLWVIVRPGPYACAEWEMGGLPWWLLLNEKIRLRTNDPAFLKPAVRYIEEVARQLAPLQVTRGGPILMFQVENEYGSFGEDAAYMGDLRQALLDGGIDVPLFACNPPGAIANGLREDLFQVVNFGPGGARTAFETLRTFQKTGPLMNGEYYPAWFDLWGAPHRTTDVRNFIGDLELMMQNGNSFSIYMAHGGTSFGPWGGADRPFRPDTSSYDYDAPISEAGWPSASFGPLRELFGRHLMPWEDLPPIPENNPVIEIPEFTLSEAAGAFDHLPTPKTAVGNPPSMELVGQSRGHMVYRTTLPAGPAGRLRARAVHDFAWVFLDGKCLGVMDRRSRRFHVRVPARTASARLDFYIATMGRVNFGQEIFDRKGLHGPVEFVPEGTSTAQALAAWEIFSLPLDDAQLAGLSFTPTGKQSAGPTFWRGSFNLEQIGDTFLDVRSWGKGYVWINGHNLGRYWNIGPTQTMYVPAPWLRKGRNDIVVLDLIGPERPVLRGRKLPELDEVRPTLDFAVRARATGTFDAAGATVAAEGEFSAELRWQETKFGAAARGRYLCIEALSAHDSSGAAAIAELDAFGENRGNLSKDTWKVLWVSSEETQKVPGFGEHVLDGQPASFWHTRIDPSQPPRAPHRIVIDFGREETVGALRYLPRGGAADATGRIARYRILLSTTPFGLNLSD